MEIKNVSELILIKFTSLKFAESFREGTIYMNTMDYFRRIEGDKDTRGDFLEGTHSIISKEKLEDIAPRLGMYFSENIKNAMVGGVSLISEELKYYNIFSMYKLNCDFATGYIEPIDSRINNFGDTFVLITDFKEFKRRIVMELKKGKYNTLGFAGEEVKYYRPDDNSQNLGPFRKINSYSWQNEYRLIAEPLEYKLKPLILNIGDLSDITIIGSTKKLIEQIHFNSDNQIVIPGYN